MAQAPRLLALPLRALCTSGSRLLGVEASGTLARGRAFARSTWSSASSSLLASSLLLTPTAATTTLSPHLSHRLAPAAFCLSTLRCISSTSKPEEASAASAASAAAPASSSSSSVEVAAAPAVPPSAEDADDDPDKNKVGERARAIFSAAWSRLEARHGDRLRAPREQIYLMGAPGSGKGTNTVFILESRGLTRAVTMSSLLQSDARIAAAMAAGELVPDELVADALLETVFDPDADPAGVLVDGFPRTALQVDLLKLLHDKVEELHEFHAEAAAAKAKAAREDKGGGSFTDADSSSSSSSSSFIYSSAEERWPRPSFKVVVLYVDQAESVRRQLARARLAATHNARVLDAGAGQLVDVRATDVDEALCKRRYAVFKQHYSTVLRLRRWFVFSLIDSGGSLDATRAQILRELRYQSSLDLEEETYAAIRHLPLAAELARAARQGLVSALDGHKRRHGELFEGVVGLISREVVPLLRSSALAGFAEYTTQDKLLESPLAQQMLIDVLTDRGFGVAHAEIEKVVPVKVDLTTGRIEVSREKKQRFRVTFERGSSVVRGADAAAAAAAASAAAAAPSPAAAGAPSLALAPGMGASAGAAAVGVGGVGGVGGGGALGSTTVVPRHLDHSQSLDDAEARWRKRNGEVSSSDAAHPLHHHHHHHHPPPPRFSPERRPELHPEDDEDEEGKQTAASRE